MNPAKSNPSYSQLVKANWEIGRRNILDMCRFYLIFSKWQTVSAKLSWSLYISLHNKHFSVDLVFYHRILKCFVLIDLKTRKAIHGDIGQMNLYLNYFKAEENVEGDDEPIGIILSAEKDEVMVEYAMGGISSKIFVSKYQLYLPDKKLLQKKIKAIIHEK